RSSSGTTGASQPAFSSRSPPRSFSRTPACQLGGSYPSRSHSFSLTRSGARPGNATTERGASTAGQRPDFNDAAGLDGRDPAGQIEHEVRGVAVDDVDGVQRLSRVG